MRVLVVRPRLQAEETARRLVGLGHEPLVAPVLTIVPSRRGPPDMGPDAALVTSRHGAAALAAHRERLAALPVFAVGPRTGSALAEAGFADVRVAAGDGAALAALVASSLAGGATLLHVAGRDRRPEPEASLRASGFRLTTWEAYAAEPATSLPEDVRAALLADGVDAVLHYSARSADILCRLAEETGLASAMARARHLCLSPGVAAALRLPPHADVAVAAEPREDRLVALLDSPLAETD